MEMYKYTFLRYFDGLNVADITAHVLQRILNRMRLDGCSFHKMQRVKFMLNQLFTYLIDFEGLEFNPLNKIKLKQPNETTKYKAMPKDLRSEFLEKLNDHALLRTICYLGLFAGLRISEILALKWSAIDFSSKTIMVHAALSLDIVFDQKGNFLSSKSVIGNTKTVCSVRSVGMPNILRTTLMEWKRNSIYNNPTDFVISNNGNMRTYAGLRKKFERFRKRTGLHQYGISFHTMRHTYATMLFEMGENPKVVQFLLGHKSLEMTLANYMSLDTTMTKSATERFNQVFS